MSVALSLKGTVYERLKRRFGDGEGPGGLCWAGLGMLTSSHLCSSAASDFNFTSSVLPLNHFPSAGNSLSWIAASLPHHRPSSALHRELCIAFLCAHEQMSSGREGGVLWCGFSVIPGCFILGLCPLISVTFQHSPYCAH